MLWFAQLTKHVFIEIEFQYIPHSEEWYNWIYLGGSLSRKRDHAGFEINIDLYRFSFHFIIYDHRHWNYDEDRWVNYEDFIS